MDVSQKKIIDLFVRQELLLADLYVRFSSSFPEYHDFWLKMASEEREHAGWVQYLSSGAVSDRVFFAEGKTRANSVSTYVEYLENTIAAFGKKPKDIIKALAMSRDIESSLIEKNMFKNFEGDSEEVQKVLAILEEAQHLHCNKINEELARAKKRSNR